MCATLPHQTLVSLSRRKILLVTLDDRYEMLHGSHVAQFQFSSRWSLMGAQHHAIIGMDIDKCKSHDFKPILHGTCTTGPESTDMRSLLTRLADVARINGYSQYTSIFKCRWERARLNFNQSMRLARLQLKFVL